MNKYLSIIQAINNHIHYFNNYLKEDYQLGQLEVDRLTDDSYFQCLNGKTWEEIRFPRNCSVGGVYFYFGYSISTPEKLCIYVGKASLHATTGQRLWSHFKHAFDEFGQIFKIGNDGERYNIEAITLIPFENKDMICFAPALEEHIITGLAKEGIYELINIRGN